MTSLSGTPDRLPVRTVAFMPVLMRLAFDLGRARRSGDPQAIAAAEKAHDDYQRVCLDADDLVGMIPW